MSRRPRLEGLEVGVRLGAARVSRHHVDPLEARVLDAAAHPGAGRISVRALLVPLDKPLTQPRPRVAGAQVQHEVILQRRAVVARVCLEMRPQVAAEELLVLGHVRIGNRLRAELRCEAEARAIARRRASEAGRLPACII